MIDPLSQLLILGILCVGHFYCNSRTWTRQAREQDILFVTSYKPHSPTRSATQSCDVTVSNHALDWTVAGPCLTSMVWREQGRASMTCSRPIFGRPRLANSSKITGRVAKLRNVIGYHGATHWRGAYAQHGVRNGPLNAPRC